MYIFIKIVGNDDFERVINPEKSIDNILNLGKKIIFQKFNYVHFKHFDYQYIQISKLLYLFLISLYIILLNIKIFYLYIILYQDRLKIINSNFNKVDINTPKINLLLKFLNELILIMIIY